MKKTLSVLLVIFLLTGLLSGITAFAADKTVASLGYNEYYSQQTLTKFSEGKSASLTISVDELGTDWFSSGVSIVVNTKLQDTLPMDVWQSTGADGVFVFSFQKNDKNEMIGTIYRCGEGKSSTSAADWAMASLQGDITIEVKKNGDGVTALYLNGNEWVPYSSSGLSIPDGYLGIVTSPNAKVTVKKSVANTSTTVNNVTTTKPVNSAFGYHSQQKLTKFSKGQSASMTISVSKLGTDWFSTGLTIVVNPKLQDNLATEVWQSKGAAGLFSFSFQANANNEMVGMIYRYGEGKGSTAGADWVKASLAGDITIEIKQTSNGTTALYLNGYEWTPHGSSGFSIPDGYLAIVTTPGSIVTVKKSEAAKPVAKTTTTTNKIIAWNPTTTNSADISDDSDWDTNFDDSDFDEDIDNDYVVDSDVNADADADEGKVKDKKSKNNKAKESVEEYYIVLIVLAVALIVVVAAIIVVVILMKKNSTAEVAAESTAEVAAESTAEVAAESTAEDAAESTAEDAAENAAENAEE